MAICYSSSKKPIFSFSRWASYQSVQFQILGGYAETSRLCSPPTSPPGSPSAGHKSKLDNKFPSLGVRGTIRNKWSFQCLHLSQVSAQKSSPHGHIPQYPVWNSSPDSRYIVHVIFLCNPDFSLTLFYLCTSFLFLFL